MATMAAQRGAKALYRWCSLLDRRAFATAQQPQKQGGLRDVQSVIAVASGKGGVGKSTVAGVARAGRG
jgi:Mrp family chromosome partitioning ATPase